MSFFPYNVTDTRREAVSQADMAALKRAGGVHDAALCRSAAAKRGYELKKNANHQKVIAKIVYSILKRLLYQKGHHPM